METILTIAVETKDWTEGNHAWFDAKLKPYSLIEVEWGDDKKSIMQTFNESRWCRVAHYYEKSKGKEDRYIISLKSADPSALLALVDGTWEMTVKNMNFNNCPELKYLQYTQLPDTNFSNAPNIEILDINEYYGAKLDTSCLLNLKKLIFRRSSYISTLDLTQNNELEELDVSFCKVRNIKVSNLSKLRIVSNQCTEIIPKSLEWLQKTVERNGGQIQEDRLNSDFLSRGCYGEVC